MGIMGFCRGIGVAVITAKRIVAGITVLALVVCICIPWYFVELDEDGTKNHNTARWNMWYIHGSCDINCTYWENENSTSPFLDNEIHFWEFDEAIGLRIVFGISWGCAVLAIFVLLPAVLFATRGKIFAVTALTLLVVAVMAFLFVPTVFPYCLEDSPFDHKGPCHHMFAWGEETYTAGDGQTYSLRWGPFYGFYIAVLGIPVCLITLILSLIAPSTKEDEEDYHPLVSKA